MKKIKYLLLSLMLILLPLGVNAESETEDVKEPVKVYMFEAGGCPWCEQQQNYFESLDGYGEKFVVIHEEMYIDHIDYEPGADYDLGNNVSKAFQNAKISNTEAFGGTPYVVISDVYAMSGFNESLETVIDQVYENGDKDVVGCIAEGRDDCLPGVAVKKVSTKAIVIAVASAAVIVVAIVVLNNQMNKAINVNDVSKEKTKEEKKEPTKKTKNTKSKNKK